MKQLKFSDLKPSEVRRNFYSYEFKNNLKVKVVADVPQPKVSFTKDGVQVKHPPAAPEPRYKLWLSQRLRGMAAAYEDCPDNKFLKEIWPIRDMTESEVGWYLNEINKIPKVKRITYEEMYPPMPYEEDEY